MAYKNDMDGYWESYKAVQNQIFDELGAEQQNSPSCSPNSVFQPIHWECVYCHQQFDTLEQIQTHYTRNQVGTDALLIPASRRGYEETSWRRGQKVINAPTIKSVLG